ncbi:unnamed protein product, partial [Dovyalis caffra]
MGGIRLALNKPKKNKVPVYNATCHCRIWGRENFLFSTQEESTANRDRLLSRHLYN